MGRGETQKTVARNIGICPSYLNKIERKAVPITQEILAKLADYYGVSRKELLN